MASIISGITKMGVSIGKQSGFVNNFSHQLHPEGKKFRVLVTGGGSGRLGPMIGDNLRERGFHVVNSTSNKESKTGVYMNLKDPAHVAHVINQTEVQAIVHSAGISSGTFDRMRSVNVDGAIHIRDAAAAANKGNGIPVAYASTVATHFDGLTEDEPYAFSKQLAAYEMGLSSDAVIMPIGVLVGDPSQNNVTPALTDLAGIPRVVRFNLEGNPVIQLMTYEGAANIVGAVVKDFSDNSNREKGVKEVPIVGEPTLLNDFLRQLNPNAKAVVTLGDINGLTPFVREVNNGVMTEEFIRLNSFKAPDFLSTEAARALVGSEFPEIDETVLKAQGASSLKRVVDLSKQISSTAINNGSLEMVRGMLQVLKSATIKFGS